MMRKLILLSVSIFFTLLGNAQSNTEENYTLVNCVTFNKNTPTPNFGKNEYIYLSWKIDWIHNFYNSQARNTSGTPIQIENPTDEINPNKSSFVGYKPTLGAAILLNYDFDWNEDFGLVAGVNIQQKKYTYNYKGISGGNFYEDYRLTSAGIPFFIKYGKDHFDDMRYVFLGAKYNFNLALSRKGNFNTTEKVKVPKGNFLPSSISYIGGFNYRVLRVELEYQPITTFQKDLSTTLVYPLVYDKMGNYFGVKTSLHIPLSRWIWRRPYHWSKRIRGIFK